MDFSTREQIQRLVDERVRETARLDFKRALPPKERNSDIAKDLSAMANASGGIIVVGIGERFGRAAKPHPFNLAGAAERIASIARGLIDEPLVLDDILEVVMNDQNEGVLVLRVERSERVPHFVDGQAWGRSGPTNVTLSRAESGDYLLAPAEHSLKSSECQLGDLLPYVPGSTPSNARSSQPAHPRRSGLALPAT